MLEGSRPPKISVSTTRLSNKPRSQVRSTDRTCCPIRTLAATESEEHSGQGPASPAKEGSQGEEWVEVDAIYTLSLQILLPAFFPPSPWVPATGNTPMVLGAPQAPSHLSDFAQAGHHTPPLWMCSESETLSLVPGDRGYYSPKLSNRNIINM